MKWFFQSPPLEQLKIEITLEERAILVKKNAESPLKESPKSTKVKKPNEDQQFAQEAENISKSPSRILFFVIS